MMLAGRQNVDRKVTRASKIRIAGGLTRQTPEHERRIERNRGKRIHGNADPPTVFRARADYGYARSKLAQCPAEVPPIEALRRGACGLLKESFGRFCFHEPGEK